MKRFMGLVVVVCGWALIAAQAQAQTMYRCGKVYQDRPCAAGEKGKAMGSTTSSAPASGTSGVDAECAQKGKDALKIVWSREGGATEERLLSEARSDAERRFVRDVFRRGGGASHVQAQVAADCMVEKERAEQADALAIAAALKARREGKLASPSAPSAAPAGYGNPNAQADGSRDQAAREAERKKRTCASYNASMDNLRSAERAGGSARRMDELNDSRRRLRDQMSAAGC